MSSRVVNAVRAFLTSNHMFVEDEWLTGCVEYLTENSGNNLSIIQIQDMAKEQWLLNDLKDMCPGCLPPDLTAQKKTVLTGRYVLQINAAIDIGTPAYQQYLKIQKVNMDNVEATLRTEDKVPNHRMIKLYLTDGEQDITGIEYKPMRNLACNIALGAKVLIKGPVDCRRGVLLLTESSIELLGGDVSDIAANNSLPALLAAKLGLRIPEETDVNIASYPRNTDVPAPHSDISTWPSNTKLEQKPDPNSKVIKIEDDIDIDEINALEALLAPIHEPKANNERLEIKAKVEVVDKGVNVELDPVKRPSQTSYDMPEKKFKVDTISDADYPDDIDLMYEENEELLKDIDTKIDNYESRKIENPRPKVVNSDPFVYIKQINELPDAQKCGRAFKVKAQVMKLLSKLTVSKDRWCLKCTIVDGTGSLDVEFSSMVLSKLVGYTPLEMNKLKKDMDANPHLKDCVILALAKAKATLQVLYCIIEITIQDVPRITNLTPFDTVHVGLLKKRMENAGF